MEYSVYILTRGTLYIFSAAAYDPSSFFHLAYPRISRKSNVQEPVVTPTKRLNFPWLLYNSQGMFIPNIPATRVSTAIASDAIVNVSCS